jgi:lipoprotein-anchoring transpeptidase ErfK/SrfK
MLKTTFLTILALQICLDRRGFSPNAMDGQYGPKTHTALKLYCEANALPPPRESDALKAYGAYFPGESDLFTTLTVTADNLDEIISVPATPAGKAKLKRLGYSSVKEMFAELGHVTEHTLARLNPGIDWNRVAPGTEITIPEVSPVAFGGKASYLKVSLSSFLLSAHSADGRVITAFPCSIAKNKSALPPVGMLKITTTVPAPNYTYTPEGAKKQRHIFPPGPNNPVGTVWLGLSRPGYGIHGCPEPERIGRAESHGCFRLANWNAEKLFELVSSGTRVFVEK